MGNRKSIQPSYALIQSIGELLVLSLVAGTLTVGAWAQDSIPKVTGNARVDRLLSAMSLEEKIGLLHGTDEPQKTSQGEAGYLAGVPRLGIPPLRLGDGPPGVLTRVPSTAPTATMGLAATFSVKDADLSGELIGRESRSHGIDIILEPFINIDRDFAFGRGYNTFGEDPFLTGQIGAAEIRGIQREGVMSQAKHFIGYDTDGTDVYIDDQTLHEVYLAPFAAAADAGVSSIMCSYNQVNGHYACGNNDTLSKILRDQIGFKGFVTSDWGATHATGYINAGLDMEMPGPLRNPTTGPSFFARDYPHPQQEATGPSKPIRLYTLPEEPPSFMDPYPPPNVSPTDLLSEVQAGRISEETITRAAGRVLLEMDTFGLLNEKRTTGQVASVEQNAEVNKKTSEDAAVLLKNEGNILPLTKKQLASVAFIGPGAEQVVSVGRAGEKAVGLPERQVGPLEALKTIVGPSSGLQISYAVENDMQGKRVPAEFLSHNGASGLESGLERTSGGAGLHPVDQTIGFSKSRGNALPADHSYAWRGTLTAPESGSYRLHLQVLGCFSSLKIDGEEVAGNWRNWIHGDITQAGQDNIFPTKDGLDNIRVELNLSVGPHSVEVSANPDGSHAPVQIVLAWVLPSERAANHTRAIEEARAAKTAVVFAWSRGTPSFGLPGDQDRMIEEIAEVNPNTVVVLNVCQPVAMPWLSKVKGVLLMWWPGDEGGWASARVLLGKVSPAGRLPFTWPRHLEDSAAADPAHPERSGRGVKGKTTFSEGIFVGYRWFDAKGIEPLFPFGYGLSYTKFSYSGLNASRATDSGLNVRFRVENAGNTASDEVPQVYLGAPSIQADGVQFASRKLVGFDRIHLDPGEARDVSIHVPLRQLQYWSPKDQNWAMPAGRSTVYVGGSSRDLGLSAEVTQ